MFKNTDEYYKSKHWQLLREQAIKKATNEFGEIICSDCKKPIVKKYDCQIDHIKELTNQNLYDEEINSLNNLQVLCFDCHNKKSNRFGYFKQKVYLVHGCMCAGKSTFVKQHAGKDDIILDVDSIWEMISNNPRYEKPNTLLRAVMQVRERMYEIIRDRIGQWHNAWIITTMPFIGDREKLVKQLGIDEVIHIDTPKEECIRNLHQDISRTPYFKEHEKLIEDYFDKFQM